MKGFVAGPVTLVLGKSEYQFEVYVAPMSSDMLLGLDFMVKYGGVVSLPENYFKIGEDIVPRIVNEIPGMTQPVIVSKTTVVPPNSLKIVSCKMADDLMVCLIEPTEEKQTNNTQDGSSTWQFT